MTRAGRKLYDWVNAQDPNAEFWDDMTAVERRWWNREAQRRVQPFTPAQRLVIWVGGALIGWAALAGLVAVIWWAVTR